MAVPITITADEVNCLIHAYFQDSGFQHSAFTLRMEGRLDHSHHIKKHIPRGELVERLSKALLYAEVEAHWKGDSFAKNCKSSFSLLERHVCSVDPSPTTLLAPQQAGESSTAMPAGETGSKRKSISPATEDGRTEKRARKEIEDNHAAMVVDGPSSITPKEAKSSELQQPVLENTVKKLKPKLAVRLLQAHKAEVFVVAWNPITAGQLVSGSRDATLNYWDVPFGSHEGSSSSLPRPTLTLSNIASSSQADLTSVDWSPDGSLVAIGCYDAIVRIHTSSGKSYLMDDHHKGPVFAAKFSPSGQWIATASLDSTSCVWDVKNKRLHRQYRNHEGNVLLGSPDGTRLINVSEACCLDVDWIDDTTFASSGSDRVVHIVSLNGTKPIQTLRGHEGELNMVKCNPSRTRLVTCSDDTTARIWNIEHLHSEKPISTPVVLKGHKRCLTSAKWCPNTQAAEHELVATASFDYTARLWDSVTGDCLKVFTDHSKYVFALSFSPDGTLLASGGSDGSLNMYDVKTRERVWNWSCGEKTGIFEIDWKKWGDKSLIALAMEHKVVGVVDPAKLPQVL